MARATQYIGLSSDASKFLRQHNAKVLCEYHMTMGLCQESVMGRIYECDIPVPGIYSYEGNEYMDAKKVVFMEVVQKEIWDGGPMIFTCLRDLNTGQLVGKWLEDILIEMGGGNQYESNS